MSQLRKFSRRSFPALFEARLRTVLAGTVFFVSEGRNAWHSTWVQTYWAGCMHSSLASAKKLAEKSRKQGSVFQIQELPCLQCNTDQGSIIVTEINSRDPLSGYSADAIDKMPLDGATLISGAQDNYLSPSAPAHGLALSFDPKSRFWTKRPSLKNSVIILASECCEETEFRRSHESYHFLQSFSQGTQYLLGWRHRPSRVSDDAIMSLSNAFSKLVS